MPWYFMNYEISTSNEPMRNKMEDNYHSDFSAVSKTMLNTFCDSPLDFKLTYIDQTKEQKKSTKAMEFGTILHECLLENKKPSDVCQPYDSDCYKSNGAINPKPAGEFRKRIAPRFAVKPSEFSTISNCYAAVLNSVLGDALEVCRVRESRFDAVINGVPCRAKPDMLADVGDYVLAYDLKFCDPFPGPFNRSARMFRYWLQDAHYSAVVGAECNYGKPVEFRFFACETAFPYRVHCYWYSPRQREIARDFHARKLNELAACYELDSWEDNWPNVLTLNPWDLGDTVEEEPELVGFDDE